MLEKNKLNNFIVNHLSLLNKQQKFYRNKIQINETKYLLVDGYNYLSKFFYIGEEVNHSKLFIIKKKINKFIDLCREKDFKLIVFIDAYIKTQETYNKWIKRREIEVKTNKKSVPYCVGTILYHYFSIRNVPVYFSYTHDNDDTMASYASELENAYILSGDHDFFRYNYKTYPIVYSTFRYINNQITFLEHKRKRPNIGVKFRNVIYPLPKVCKTYPIKENLKKYNISVRGVVTSMCKELGNVHKRIKNLRRKCYYKIFYDKLKKKEKLENQLKTEKNIFIRSAIKIKIKWLDYKSTIEEIYPEWDKNKNKVIWKKEIVKPMKYNKIDNFNDLLEKYFSKTYLKKVRNLFDKKTKSKKISSIKYTNYLFSVYASILEMKCICEDKKFVDELNSRFLKSFKCKCCGKLEYLDKINHDWYINKFNTLPKKCFNCRKSKNINI
jgi:hypothetical protein